LAKRAQLEACRKKETFHLNYNTRSRSRGDHSPVELTREVAITITASFSSGLGLANLDDRRNDDINVEKLRNWI